MAMSSFLVTSLVLSVVATVALNVLPRLFPNQARKAEERVARSIEDGWSSGPDRTDRPGPSVRVFFPWKAMLIGSVVLTVLVNVFGRLA